MGNRIYRVNSQKFVIKAATGYQIGNINDDILHWINNNVKSYQLYTIEGHYSMSGVDIIAEVLVYEAE